MDYEVMTFKDLRKYVPFSRTHIDRMENRGCFPKSFKLAEGRGARRVWWRSEVIDWLKGRSR